MLGLASLTLVKPGKSNTFPCLGTSPIQNGTVPFCGSSVGPCGSCVIPAVPAPPDPSAWCGWVASGTGEGQRTSSSCTCTNTRLLLQLHLFIPTPVFRAGHGPGRALSPYLLTQGANEPFQVLLLVQHHLLLLVLLLQLHLQLPELCGTNPAMLRAQPPLQVPAGQSHCHSGHLAFPKVSAASTGDQEWAMSPGAPPYPWQCQCRREEALQGPAGHWGQDGLCEAHPAMPKSCPCSSGIRVGTHQLHGLEERIFSANHP